MKAWRQKKNQTFEGNQVKGRILLLYTRMLASKSKAPSALVSALIKRI